MSDKNPTNDALSALAIGGTIFADIYKSDVAFRGEVLKGQVAKRSIARSIAKLEAESLSSDLDLKDKDDLNEDLKLLKEGENNANTPYAKSIYKINKQIVQNKVDRNTKRDKWMANMDDLFGRVEQSQKSGVGLDWSTGKPVPDESISLININKDIKEIADNIRNGIELGYIKNAMEYNRDGTKLADMEAYQSAIEKLSIFDGDTATDLFDMPGVDIDKPYGKIDTRTQQDIFRALQYIRAKDYTNADKAMDDAINSSDEIADEQFTSQINNAADFSEMARKDAFASLGAMLKNVPIGEIRTPLDEDLVAVASPLLGMSATEKNFLGPRYVEGVKKAFYSSIELIEIGDSGLFSGDVLEQDEQSILDDEGTALYLGGKIYRQNNQWVFSNFNRHVYMNEDGKVVNPYGSFGVVNWDYDKISENKLSKGGLFDQYPGEFGTNKKELVSQISSEFLKHGGQYKNRLTSHVNRSYGKSAGYLKMATVSMVEKFKDVMENNEYNLASVEQNNMLNMMARHVSSLEDEREIEETEKFLKEKIMSLVANKKMTREEAKAFRDEFEKRVKENKDVVKSLGTIK